MPPNIQQALEGAATRLAASSRSPRADAEILLAHALDCARSHLIAWPQKPLTSEQTDAYRQLVDCRAAGQPVAYLTGFREFWSLPLRVDRSVLIPRAETETLVEFVLLLFGPDTVLRVADLGTGSGAIACALASERPHWDITATDISPPALATARGNAAALGLGNIDFILSNWLEGVDPATRFDVILANPPYIADDDPHLTQGDPAFEPRVALVSGEDGLDDIRRIAAEAPNRLTTGGWLIVEHGYDQSQKVATIFRDAGLSQIRQQRDLAGILRMAAGRRS